MASRRGNGTDQIVNGGRIDQDTWDADTQAIAQANQDFDVSDIPDIQFTPAESLD